MPKRSILFLLAAVFFRLINCNIIYAQEAEKHSVLSIHFFPLTALEIDGGLRAGLEVNVSPKISVMADYNYLLNALQKDAAKTNFTGYTARLEPRFYFRAGKDYAGLQLMYKTKSWEFKNSLDSIKPLQEIYVTSLKYGRKHYFSNHFGVDYYVGIGGGVRNNTVAFGDGFLRTQAGYSFRPNFLLGASIFYKI